MRINGKRASYYSSDEISRMLFFRKTRNGEVLTKEQMDELIKVLYRRNPLKLNLSDAYGKTVCE